MDVRKKNILNQSVLILGIFAFSIISFFNSIELKQHFVIAEAADRFTHGISSAISAVVYDKGLNFMSLVKVVNTYQEMAVRAAPPGAERLALFKNGEIQNAAILAATTLKNPDELGFQKLDREDKGQILFFISAFKIFGFKVQSFVYFYYLLLFLSLLFFILEFFAKPSFLLIPLSFMFAHGVIMKTIWGVGIELLTPANPRFLPVLGIIPAFHLILIVISSHFNYKKLPYTVFQVLLLVLVLISRSSANYLLILFFGMTAFTWLRRNYGVLKQKKVSFSGINIKSFLIIFLLLFSTIYLYKRKISANYGVSQKTHYFWHPLYLGLFYHPTSKLLYGHHCCNDSTSFQEFQKYQDNAAKKGEIIPFSDQGFEAFLKESSLTFIKNNPVYTFKNYVYKFYRIMTLPLDQNYPLLASLFGWSSLLFLALLCYSIFQIKMTEPSLLCIVLLLPILASLPLMILGPEYYAASDFVVNYLVFISFIPFGLKFIFQRYLMEKTAPVR